MVCLKCISALSLFLLVAAVIGFLLLRLLGSVRFSLTTTLSAVSVSTIPLLLRSALPLTVVLRFLLVAIGIRALRFGVTLWLVIRALRLFTLLALLRLALLALLLWLVLLTLLLAFCSALLPVLG